ncbi:MAG: DUF3105 domain-containing protein [Fibrobacteria bacterium]
MASRKNRGWRKSALLVASAAVFLCACSREKATPTAEGCAPPPASHALQSGVHVAVCSPLSFSEYPPTSGKHYPVWGDYKTYASVLAPGFYVHDMEHGGVVFLINCRTAGNCPADMARLQTIADAYPADPLCDAATKHRIVIAQDTLIPTRFAALAWGWSLPSDCFDSTAFQGFLAAHYAQGPEDLCDENPEFAQYADGCPAVLPE